MAKNKVFTYKVETNDKQLNFLNKYKNNNFHSGIFIPKGYAPSLKKASQKDMRKAHSNLWVYGDPDAEDYDDALGHLLK